MGRELSLDGHAGEAVSEPTIDMEQVIAIAASGTHDCCLWAGWGRSENPSERQMDPWCSKWGGCKRDAMKVAMTEEIRLVNEARGRGETPDGSHGALLDRARARIKTMNPADFMKKPEPWSQRDAERFALTGVKP